MSCPIQPSQARVHREMICAEQGAKICPGILPDHFVQEDVERCAQIGFERLVKLGKNLRVLGNLLGMQRVRPYIQEGADLGY